MEEFLAVNKLLRNFIIVTTWGFRLYQRHQAPHHFNLRTSRNRQDDIYCHIPSNFFIMGHSRVACATDHLAIVFQNRCPELGAIRFHAFDNESRAIRRQERDSFLANKSGKAPGQEGDSAPPAKPADKNDYSDESGDETKGKKKLKLSNGSTEPTFV